MYPSRVKASSETRGGLLLLRTCGLQRSGGRAVILRYREGEWPGAIRAIFLEDAVMDEEFVSTLRVLKRQALFADQVFLAYLIEMAELEAARIKGFDGSG